MDFIFCKKRGHIGTESIETSDDVLEDEQLVKDLAKKSGFSRIEDRVDRLKEKTQGARRIQVSNGEIKTIFKDDSSNQNIIQFATLNELFASKFHRKNHVSNCYCDECLEQRRPKMPVMKLSKDDWNVKCWENRLGRRQPKVDSRMKEIYYNKLIKPAPQIEVFQGRIDDVAMKLDRIREGAPADDRLFELTTNRNIKKEVTHSWTDLLKDELIKGKHRPEQLRNVCNQTEESTATRKSKSPLGRPIRKLVGEQESIEDNRNHDK